MSDLGSQKKVDIIGIVGLPACYGGFESLVQNLVDFQSPTIQYRVYCSAKYYSKQEKKYKNSHLTYLPFKANGGSSIFYDITGLLVSLFRKPDVILILGVSGCISLPLVRLFSSAKIITNIDGLEWKREKWGKLAKKFLKLSEKISVKYSDVIIADNKAISDYVKKEYGVSSKVIAYGGDHAVMQFNMPQKKQDYYFTVCRIEPENNIAMILEAFSKTTCQLKIVGNWESSLYGRQLKEKYSSVGNIDLIDPIYDAGKLFILRSNCKCYIHGHSAGGTNPSLVEAMHFQTPIIAFDCNFNRYSTEDAAYYFENANELIEMITNQSQGLMNDSDEICAKRMKEIATQRYTWSHIIRMYEELY